MDQVVYPHNFIDTTPEEFSMLLCLLMNSEVDQRLITKETGMGVRKTPAVLRALKNKGFIDYIPGRVNSTKLLLGHISNGAIIPVSYLKDSVIRKRPTHLMILAYLSLFAGTDFKVIKKRKVLQDLTGTSKTNVNHVLSELESGGYLKRVMLDISRIEFTLIPRVSLLSLLKLPFKKS